MTRNSGSSSNASIQWKSISTGIPPSGGMVFQNFARNPVLVNKRLSAPYYRTQTLASMMAKSPRNLCTNAKADHVGEGVAQSRVLFHDKRSLHMMKRGQIR